MRRSLSILALAVAPFLFAACTAEQDLGSREGTSSTRLAQGAACSCEAGEDCCEEGLICDPCRSMPMGALACASSNGVPDRKCRAPRPDGTLCDHGGHCTPGSACVKAENDTRFFCKGLGNGSVSSGRCRESLDCGDGKVCVDSHCKLARGERCEASHDCASNKCYGSVEYRCL